MEDPGLYRRQDGFIRFGTMTLLVSGLAFFGLLNYGMTSGQELPLWPAIAVALVNVIAAAKIIMNVKKARRQQQAPASKDATCSNQFCLRLGRSPGSAD